MATRKGGKGILIIVLVLAFILIPVMDINSLFHYGDDRDSSSPLHVEKSFTHHLFVPSKYNITILNNKIK